MGEDIRPERRCEGCGAVVAPDAPFGHCPKCLLQHAIDLGINDESGGSASGGDIAPAHVHVASQLIGRYKLLEKIGEGGCGIVYLAEQEAPFRRRVALKIIKPGMDTREIVARFEVERQALAMMEHPNIAKVFDGGATAAGRPYFVMELVRGQRITEYCDQKKLSTQQRLDLFMQVCQAVHHAHQKGIIHRDLKPSNILVTVNDGVAVPKVIDFGIAKATGQLLTDKTLFTKFHQLIGTPAYMSPEQTELTSVDIDTRSDIYSLGILLYELLTGRAPFDSKELLSIGFEQMLRTIRDREPVQPSQKLSTLAEAERTTVAQQRQTDPPRLVNLLRGDLDWIVMKSLEKDRARRYESANGLAADIQRHLNNEPVLAGPPGNLYRLQKTIRRHRVAFATGGAVLAALVIGLGVATIMFMREVAERRRGDVARAEVVKKNIELERRNAEFSAMLVVGSRSDHLVAEEKFRLGQEQAAFVHLARAIEYDPSSTLLAEKAIAALSSWSHELPTEILVGHTGELYSAQVSPNGKRIVTASRDRTARVWDMATGEMLTILEHTGRVQSAEFSPDGTRIVTGSWDKTARVWDPIKGESLATLVGHENSVVGAQFSPDGTRVVTTSVDRTARVWDALSGEELVTLAGYTNILFPARFSPDGTRIVTAGDGTALVWDSATGKKLATLAGHKRSLRGAWFSADGTRIVTASADRTARVWDTRSGDVLLTLVGHEGPNSGVERAQFSPDGTRIVTAGRDDKTVRIWEASTGKLLKTLVDPDGDVQSAQFSPSGDRIVSVSQSKSDSTARVWDSSTGKLLATLAGHHAGVWSAQFSPDGKYIVTASGDETVRIWDVATMRATPAKPYRSRFSSDGKLVATVSDDRNVHVWDVATGKAVTLAGHTGRVWSAEFSPDGTRIVTASDMELARLWDVSTGRLLATLAGHTGEVQRVQFSPDSKRIVTMSSDKTAQVWDTATGKALVTLAGHTGEVWSAQFSLDGTRIITTSHQGPARVLDVTTGEMLGTLTNRNQGWPSSPDKPIAFGWTDETVRVWETGTGKELATFAGNTGEVWRAWFSADGRQILTTSDKQPTGLWNATTGKMQASLGDPGWVTFAQFSPDSTRVATVLNDKTVRLWETTTGKALATLVGHTGQVRIAQFNLDGTRIMTASWNELAHLWDATTGKMLATYRDSMHIAKFSPDGRCIITNPGVVRNPGGAIAELWDSTTGNALAKLTGHTGFVRSASFSPDGTRIVTSSEDGTVRVWDSATGLQVAIFTSRAAVAQADKTLATLGGYDARLASAQFSPDGTRIFITSHDGTVFVWDLLSRDAGPPPEWFPDFLRYMAQMRLNPGGELERLKPDDWLALRERLRGILRKEMGMETPYMRVLRRYVRE